MRVSTFCFLLVLVSCSKDADLPPVTEGEVGLTRRFALDTEACLDASPVLVRSQGEDAVLTINQRGTVIAVDPDIGTEQWRTTLPSVPADGGEMHVFTTPVVVDERYLVVAWQALASHQYVGVLDLQERTMSAEFPPVLLGGQVPNFDGSAQVVFRPDKQTMRGTVRHLAGEGLGHVYVTLGNAPNSSPHHGWVFALSLDAWRESGPSAAITSLFSTTADIECGPEGSPDPGLCGGGIWNTAGMQFYEENGETFIYLATGNGRLNYERESFANSLLRLRPGLEFDSGCDMTLCDGFDEVNPSNACLESCVNVFAPRLGDGEAPLAPEDGSCDGLSFYECYRVLDADLGAVAPVRVTLPSGATHFVQGGKDGALYLVDGQNMGTLHQRLQVMDFCGTADEECRAFWLGMFVTHPVVAELDGEPVVILASNMADSTHPSGITAVRVSEGENGPRMSVLWQVPDFDLPEARSTFRSHPGRPILYRYDGEEYAFVVETRRGGETPPPGRIWGVRVRDGELVARTELVGSGSRWNLPLIHEDRIFVGSCDTRARDEGHLVAFDLLGDQ